MLIESFDKLLKKKTYLETYAHQKKEQKPDS